MLAPAELEQLDEATLRAALKKVRAKARAVRAAQEAEMALPPYVKPEGESDLLKFEYGFELAFRPNCKPDVIQPSVLSPLLYTPPEGKARDGYGYYGNNTPIRAMFDTASKKWAKHIGAKASNENSLTACGTNEVEFPSPIFTRWSQMEWYYARIRHVADSLGFTVDTPQKTGGGGHMHVTPLDKEWSANQQYTILLAVLHNPWIGWVFNDPDDTSTAYYPAKTMVNAIFNWAETKNSNWWASFDFDDATMVRRNRGHKTTLEFRCFQAPYNWEEQRRHVQFLEHFISWALADLKKIDKKVPPVLPYLFPHDLMRISFNEARAGFNKLVREIGLHPADYEAFLKRNMATRFRKRWPRN